MNTLRKHLRKLNEIRQTTLFPPEKITVIILLRATKHGLNYIAGLDRNLIWRFLYPLNARIDNDLRKWDVIEAEVMYPSTEPDRPEYVKIWKDTVKRIGRVDSLSERKNIITKVVEGGEFLHRKPCRKTLGLIRPIRPRFYLDKFGKIKCHFYCNHKGCKGHRMIVKDPEVTKENYQLIEEPYFLLAFKIHPSRWLLVSVIELTEQK